MEHAVGWEKMLKRDRRVVLAGLFLLTAISWAYLMDMVWAMENMDMTMAITRLVEWQWADVAALFWMWVVMMIAMMTPTAVPLVLIFARINRERQARSDPVVATSFFVGGYLLGWTVFSVAATLVQWALHRLALLSPLMVSSSPLLGGMILMAAGGFQWTPWKRACLVHCRSPIGFLTTEWREGKSGALRMGLKHGLYCVGCCWVLMMLLFVAGVMNPLWVAAITLFVLAEKAFPNGERIGRAGGVLLVCAGVFLVGASNFRQ